MQANASLIVQAFAQHLHMAGCRRAYGLAGEDHVELMAALDAVGVRYVRAYNESAAVLMAAADAQASGSFGVAIVSMSAGMSNAINGLTHAYMEQVPVLVVSGQQPAAERPFIVRQGFDVEALAKPVTKWQTKVATGTDVGRLLAKAVFVATERPCGPVYVELPADVGLTEARTDARWQPRLHQQAALSPHALPRRLDDAEFAHLDDVMASALRPLLIVGGHSRLDLAVPVADLARGHRMPVLVTPNQKGVVPPGSPYYTGVFLNGSPERQLLDQADRVLAVDLEAFNIYSRAIEGDGQIVSLSSTPIAETFIAFSEEFVGDPVDTLRRLSQSAAGARSEWTDADVRQYREGLRADLAKLDRVPGAFEHYRRRHRAGQHHPGRRHRRGRRWVQQAHPCPLVGAEPAVLVLRLECLRHHGPRSADGDRPEVARPQPADGGGHGGRVPADASGRAADCGRCRRRPGGSGVP